MEKKDYNGWKNWQTWNVALWLGNDEGLYRQIKEHLKEKKFNRDRAKEIVTDMLPQGTPDMDNGAKGFRGVDWQAISKACNEF